jgi:hypothetical protein
MQYPDDDRSANPPIPARRPKTSIPKTIGVLNIVFGLLLMMCSVCVGLSMAMQSAMAPMFAVQQQQMQQIQEAEREKRLQVLQNQEQAAADENAKAALREKQKELLAKPLVKMPDMAKLTSEMGLAQYGIADAVTGLLLNVLLVISGIGLINFKDWGRRLGIWVAALKIVRLIALYSYFIVVVVPRISKALATMFKDMGDQIANAAPAGQPAPNVAEFEQMGAMMGVMYTAQGIAMIILGVIYPIIVLILLSRPRVKAACTFAATPETSTGREDGSSQRDLS